MSSKAVNFTAIFFSLVLMGYILIIGYSFLMPLVIAIILWYLISGITNLFLKLPLGGRQLPYGIALLLALLASGAIVYGFFTVLASSFADVLREVPQYQAKLQAVLDSINAYVGDRLNVADILSKINLATMFSRLALMLSSITGNLVLILIYVLMMLLEHQTFPRKIEVLCRTQQKHQQVQQILKKIKQDIKRYTQIKTATSVLTGVLSYSVLVLFGCENAIFWAIVIFALNYIPTIGSIVAVTLTLLAVSIQFQYLSLFILMGALLITIQFIVGNIVEPKFMGKSLNLSPLVIILSLSFWGAIWGVLGMILCVPAMTIISIVMAKFDKTRPLAVLLSGDVNGNGVKV